MSFLPIACSAPLLIIRDFSGAGPPPTRLPGQADPRGQASALPIAVMWPTSSSGPLISTDQASEKIVTSLVPTRKR